MTANLFFLRGLDVNNKSASSSFFSLFFFNTDNEFPHIENSSGFTLINYISVWRTDVNSFLQQKKNKAIEHQQVCYREPNLNSYNESDSELCVVINFELHTIPQSKMYKQNFYHLAVIQFGNSSELSTRVRWLSKPGKIKWITFIREFQFLFNVRLCFFFLSLIIETKSRRF